MIENELRLGNYLLGYDNNYFTWDYGHYDLCSKGIYADELGMPIELTEEILLKCGFEQSAWDNYSTFRNLFCSDGCIVISLEHKYIEIGDLTLDIEIKYLHQLQNLYFALNGKELEINL